MVKYIKYKSVKLRLNLRHILSIIICLDQFSRHIYRENKTRLQINKNTKKAKIVSKCIFSEFLNNELYTENFDKFSEQEMIFLLMPFKHDGFDEIDYVYSLLLDYNKFNFSTNNLKCFWQDYLKKYYNSTNIFPIMNIHNEIFSIDSLRMFVNIIQKI